MKFTTAAAILASLSALSDVNAFAPNSFKRGNPSFTRGTEVRAPTRGNVSYRKIRPWHRLHLEPWSGLKLSSAVDESVELNGQVQNVEDNDAVDFSVISAGEIGHDGSGDTPDGGEDPDMYDLDVRAIRAEAEMYLKTFIGQTGAGVVFSKLEEHGVKTVNGYSGGAVLPLLDQFSDENPRHGKNPSSIRWITNSNESSAGHVAEGIAKSSTEADGKLAAGVVVATSGPGMTNLITPMQDAYCDGVPLVVLCGQAATNAPCDAFQGAPAVALATPCTKWAYQIKSSTELPFVMDYAFHVARHGRPGPVFIDLPKDLQVQPVTSESIVDYVKTELVFGTHKGPEKDFDQDHMPNNQPNLVRLKTLQSSLTNKSELIVSVGNTERGSLPFYVGESKLEPVPITSSCKANGIDSYRWDHTPSNRIYKSTEDEGESFDSDLMDELMSTVHYAKKPVIVAGQGTNDAPEELKAFAEALQIPVATTLHALGTFDERHPLALNMLGMHGHPTPNFMIQESDLIICIGSRFDDRITGNPNSFIPEAKKAAEEGRGGVIHVDLRLSEHAKQVKPTYFVHSTGKTFLTEANAYLQSNKKAISRKPTTAGWLEKMSELQKKFPVGIPAFEPKVVPSDDTTGDSSATTITQTPMSAQSVIFKLNEQILKAGTMDDFLFTTGVGIHQMVAAQLITWTQPRQMLSSGSLGTMGVALGYCVGAQLANGNKICVAIDGDGSFNMTFTELKTVAENKIPIKIMILDNEAQMMVEYWQKLFFDDRLIAVRNDQNPQYTKLADAFGIKNIYCDHAEDLEAKMQEFLFSDPGEPVLFHVRIERTPCLPLVAPGQALDNMILMDDSVVEFDKSASPS